MKIKDFFPALSLTAIGLAFNSGAAKALDFTFSFGNETGNVSGNVTGIIAGLNDNATSAATGVIIQNYPSGLSGSPEQGGFDATKWQEVYSNSFSVTNGNITAASFGATNGGGFGSTGDALCINGGGYCFTGANALSFDGASTYVLNSSGFSGVTFSSATSVPFEFSPTEGIALGMPLFIGLRMLKKKWHQKEVKSSLSSAIKPDC